MDETNGNTAGGYLSPTQILEELDALIAQAPDDLFDLPDFDIDALLDDLTP